MYWLQRPHCQVTLHEYLECPFGSRIGFCFDLNLQLVQVRLGSRCLPASARYVTTSTVPRSSLKYLQVVGQAYHMLMESVSNGLLNGPEDQQMWAEHHTSNVLIVGGHSVIRTAHQVS